jgi:hypothetical protein
LTITDDTFDDRFTVTLTPQKQSEHKACYGQNSNLAIKFKPSTTQNFTLDDTINIGFDGDSALPTDPNTEIIYDCFIITVTNWIPAKSCIMVAGTPNVLTLTLPVSVTLAQNTEYTIRIEIVYNSSTLSDHGFTFNTITDILAADGIPGGTKVYMKFNKGGL